MRIISPMSPRTAKFRMAPGVISMPATWISHDIEDTVCTGPHQEYHEGQEVHQLDCGSRLITRLRIRLLNLSQFIPVFLISYLGANALGSQINATIRGCLFAAGVDGCHPILIVKDSEVSQL